MAEYNKSRFYWLQLKEDFFDEDAIDWLEDQPNGKEYSLFYLKLCLKSLRTNGYLIRQVGNMLVPYDYIKLGELTKTNPDTVLVAMELLLKIGLVQKLENGELYIKQVENMIGSQSVGAFKKQQQLMRRENKLIEGGTEVEKIPPKIDIEKEKELDIEVRERIDYQQVADMYNEICISFPKCTSLSVNRKKAIKARLKTYTIADFKKLFTMAESSDFLKGKNDRNWNANFDWLLKDSNFAKVLDGNYNNNPVQQPKQSIKDDLPDSYKQIIKSCTY